MEMKNGHKISIIIPVYNEEESLLPLMERLVPAAKELGSHEIIFINDGSSDATKSRLDAICKENRSIIKVIHFRGNFGKSVALQAGFGMASGKIIVMMDGDLQDQPEEIHKLIDAIENKGFDAVTGWKVDRKDPLSKTFPSLYFNKMVNYSSGLNLHDHNCGLKAFRRECLSSFNLYGQLHRFIIVFIAKYGYNVGEVAIDHAPRMYGKTKYGVRRFYHGIVDILTVFFITRYMESPLHFFGAYGLSSILLSLPIGVWFFGAHFLSVMNYIGPEWHLANHPIGLSSPLLFLLGLIMIFFGLIGELINYHMMSKNAYKRLIERHHGFDKKNSSALDDR